MPIPVPIPAAPLPVTDADVVRVEALLAAFAQVMQYGTTGATLNTPQMLVPDGINPPIDTLTGKPKVVPFKLDTAEKQLMYRQLFSALTQAVFQYARQSVYGVTSLSTDPSVLTNPVALNAEEVSVTPAPNKVPRANALGLIDPAWIGAGPGPTPVPDMTFTGTCVNTDAVGDLVYISGSGKIIAKADPTNNAKMPSIGCIISKSSSTVCSVQTSDLVSGVYTGLTPGKMYFVGTNSKPTAIRPTPTPGNSLLVQPIGFAIDTNMLLLTPGTNLTRLWG